MTATVISISDQHGIDVTTIARAVAERLGYRFYDWEIIWEAAAAAGVSPEAMASEAEHAPSFLERILSHLAVAGGGPEEAPLPTVGPRLSILTSDDYRRLVEQVVIGLADKGGCVIVGRASQAILHDRPGVLKVLLLGSLPERQATLARVQGLTPEKALQEISRIDSQRGAFFKRVYHMDWLDAGNYELTLNTDFLDEGLAADLIVRTAEVMS
jgi:cytidylate kinase